ncbi:hypothetical protein FRC14_000828 [Serendipita sp. 396]|nr:hypothetical protein FRC14_000828 [Serendipita sp. 396]KAG8857707.1 hypothetical protein FRC20_000231 [Serendipita sp. 405]
MVVMFRLHRPSQPPQPPIISLHFHFHTASLISHFRIFVYFFVYLTLTATLFFSLRFPRGKSISRAMGKLAADFLSLNKHHHGNCRSDSPPEKVPAVPVLRR